MMMKKTRKAKLLHILLKETLKQWITDKENDINGWFVLECQNCGSKEKELFMHNQTNEVYCFECGLKDRQFEID